MYNQNMVKYFPVGLGVLAVLSLVVWQIACTPDLETRISGTDKTEEQLKMLAQQRHSQNLTGTLEQGSGTAAELKGAWPWFRGENLDAIYENRSTKLAQEWPAEGPKQLWKSETILSDEMALTNLEIHLGSPRGEAMRHMAERTDNEELSSLVAILVQSERFGTSVADALRTFAESVRAERSRRAEEYAEKMAVKLLVPMILFIFPTILVVVVGPAGMTLARMLLED